MKKIDWWNVIGYTCMGVMMGALILILVKPTTPPLITDDKPTVRAFIHDCDGTASIKRVGDFYELRCKGGSK